MYGYDYTPATEGISSWFKNIVETVGRKIREVTEFLRRQINELGKKLKTKKKEFLEMKAKQKNLLIQFPEKRMIF